MANGWSCVYTHTHTHLMLFHTRVHPLSLVSVLVCVCVSTTASVYLMKINPIPNTYKRTRVQWGWKYDPHTHTVFHIHSTLLPICALLWQGDETHKNHVAGKRSLLIRRVKTQSGHLSLWVCEVLLFETRPCLPLMARLERARPVCRVSSLLYILAAHLWPRWQRPRSSVC